MKKVVVLVVTVLFILCLAGCSGSDKKETEINKMIGQWQNKVGFNYTLAKEKDNTYSYTIKDAQTKASNTIKGGYYNKETKTLIFSGNEVQSQNVKFQYDAAKDELIQIEADSSKNRINRIQQ